MRARGTRDRGRGPRHGRRAARGRSARVRRRLHAPLPRRRRGRACRVSAAASPGCFGYDTVRHIEPKLARLRAAARAGARRRARHAAAADRGARGRRQPRRQDLPDRLRRSGGARRATRAARRGCSELRRKLREPVAIPFQTATPLTQAESEFGADGFQAAVRRAKEYIAAGDIMQVVLSQRMSRPFTASPLSLYRALRSLNPSPYMFYYDFGDFHVVGASPEILVRKEGDTVTLRPIAGTRPARRDARGRREARAGAPRRSRRRSPST